MKTKCIIKLSAYFIFSLVLGIFIVTSFVSCFKKICEEERKEQEIFKKSVEIKNSNPCIYEVIFTDGGKDKDNQVWPISDCYPYSKSPSHPKVTSSRALINSVAAYKILVDRVDGILNKTESNSDW